MEQNFAFLFVFVLNFGRTFFAFYGTKLFLWLPKWWSYPQYFGLYSPIVISVICDGVQNPKTKPKNSKILPCKIFVGVNVFKL